MLPRDLPGDLPSFLERFGTDEQCRAYLFRARWPDGFRCAGCGHERAWAHKARLIDECAACGKQHSLLAGTIFEQTKTGLARWFLAIYLVTSSKGGISMDSEWASAATRPPSWLKDPKAMVRPEREPLAERVEADETYVGGPRPGKAGRGAAGKIKVAGAVESGRGQAKGRRLGRLRLAVVADVSARSLKASSAGTSPGRPPSRPTAGPAIRASPPPATPTSRSTSAPLGRRRAAPAGDPPGLRPRQALAARHPPRRGLQQASAGLPRRVRLPLQPPHRQESSHRFARLIEHAVQTQPTTYRALVAHLKVMDS